MKSKYRFWAFIAEVLSWKHGRKIKREHFFYDPRCAKSGVRFSTSEDHWYYHFKELNNSPQTFSDVLRPNNRVISDEVAFAVAKDTKIFEELDNKYQFHTFCHISDGWRATNSIELPHRLQDQREICYNIKYRMREEYGEASPQYAHAEKMLERSKFIFANNMLYAKKNELYFTSLDICMWFVENVINVKGDDYIMRNEFNGYQTEDWILIERRP
jgi:hypothetical protein